MRPHYGLLFVIGASLLSGGCATAPSKSSSTVDYQKKASRLVRELRKKNALIEDLREKNQILNARHKKMRNAGPESPVEQAPLTDAAEVAHAAEIEVGLPPGAFSDSLSDQKNKLGKTTALAPLDSGPQFPVRALPKSLPAKKEINASSIQGWVRGPTRSSVVAPVATEEVRPKAGSETGESLLYGKVMQSYKRRDHEQLGRAVRLFLKTYPQSVHADNALYLEAMAAIEAKRWDAAEQTLDQLLRTYPHGNKAVSALFARAVVARNRRDFASARSLLNRLSRDYPGSVESERVQLEQRLVTQLEKTGRNQ